MNERIIIIGGSAGSFQIVTKILAALPKKYPHPIFLCLHRLKHVRTGFIEALTIKSFLNVIEPEDKTYFKGGNVYLAPANYHMFLEMGNMISLSTEPAVNHSRPAIDLSFSSAAFNYKSKVVGIILSGANRDGANGIADVNQEGGTTIAQSLEESQVKTMPEAAISITKIDHVYTSDEIITYLLNLQ
jgi:two-component system chemotaxis response regulator CheB